MKNHYSIRPRQIQGGSGSYVAASKSTGNVLFKTLTRLLLLFGLIVHGITVAATLQGIVVSITDGDTITVLDASQTQHKVRLSGIDAPERR
ncbi:MAG: thermonuclease family protein, partial [Polaromonas sp.]|uniref:thermonuclease family protein n=1 Tax=Polaromonas sp. TaxID=1869339 RepID=UPI004035243C